MSRTTLYYRVEPDQGDESAADSADRLGLGLWPALHHGFPKNLLGRLKWVVKGGPFAAFQMRRQIKNIETFCQRCGQHSRGRRRTFRHGNQNALERALRRLTRVRRRRRLPFKHADGRIDIQSLLAGVGFPVYGLKGSPLGMGLHALGWGGKGSGPIVGKVILTYAAGEKSGSRGAIGIDQGPDAMRETSEGRILSELNAITSLVRSYGTRELRREYLRRGNVHRDWNLERITRTPRRRLTLHARGAPLGVELSCWWEPEQVTLAYATPGGRPILVTSVGISHVELLRALKSLVVLQEDAAALKDHQRDYDETRRRSMIHEA